MTSTAARLSRLKATLLVVASLPFCLVDASAQTTWSTPSANSPAVVLGYMRFHLALANAINNSSPNPSRDLNAAAQETLGLSAAEFKIVTQRCQAALNDYAAAGNLRRNAATIRQQQEQVLTSYFAGLLSQLSPSGAAHLTAYLNGPFRASIRTKQVQGAMK
jgi:hypothetical protein